MIINKVMMPNNFLKGGNFDDDGNDHVDDKTDDDN